MLGFEQPKLKIKLVFSVLVSRVHCKESIAKYVGKPPSIAKRAKAIHIIIIIIIITHRKMCAFLYPFDILSVLSEAK